MDLRQMKWKAAGFPWNLNICQETSSRCGNPIVRRKRQGAEPQKEEAPLAMQIQRSDRKKIVGSDKDEEDEAVWKARQNSHSDTRGSLISGSACLGPQLSHSSWRSLLCFLFEIPSGRLIQYNRVHFVPICMYRWLISRNWICRRAFLPARALR